MNIPSFHDFNLVQSTNKPDYDIWHKSSFQNKSRLSMESEKLDPVKLQLQQNTIAVILFLRSRPVTFYLDLTEQSFLSAAPTAKQIEQGKEITEYYLNKLITQKFSGRYKPTQYKTDLASALQLAKSHEVMGSHVRLLYSLIDFYQEDLLTDRLVDKFESYSYETADLHDLTLNFVEKLCVRRRSQKRIKYFFSDNLNQLYCLDTNVDDQVGPFLDVIVNNGPIRVTGYVKRVDKFLDYNFRYAVINIKKIQKF